MRRAGTTRRGLRAAFAAAAIALAPALAKAQAEFSAVRVEAAYTFDDNVTRGPSGERLRDQTLGVRVSSGMRLPVSTETRAVFQAFAGGEKFRTYSGLSHNFLGGQGDFQFRSS